MAETDKVDHRDSVERALDEHEAKLLANHPVARKLNKDLIASFRRAFEKQVGDEK